MDLLSADDSRGVDSPFLLGEYERMQLLTADGSVAACLVFKVDLLSVDERTEDDEVAGRLERVETRQLGMQDGRVVVTGERGHESVITELGPVLQEDVLLAVSSHDQRDLVERRDAGCEVGMAPCNFAVAEAFGLAVAIDVRKAAR